MQKTAVIVATIAVVATGAVMFLTRFQSKQKPEKEDRNLAVLLSAVANEKSRKNGIIHRSITCNHCEVSPIRGDRFKCMTCPDFDLCVQCEAITPHTPAHCFIKIRIPVPPLANPRIAIFNSLYHSDFTVQYTIPDFSMLQTQTHCKICLIQLIELKLLPCSSNSNL